MKTKRILSLLTVLTMLAASIVLPITASAETTKKTMNMGGSVISVRDNIYYGYNNKTLTASKWRVLSTNGNTTDGETVSFSDGTNTVSADKALFVISESGFGQRAYNDGDVNWTGSEAQAWCNGTERDQFYDIAGITTAEQKAILTTSKTDAVYKTTVDNPGEYCESYVNEKVFYLSANEADIYFNDEEDRIFMLNGGEAVWWWLRSPYCNYNSYTVGVVDDGGGFMDDDPGDDILSSRPAFNLNMSSVLFTSAADFNGTIGNYSGNEWKLTLLDAKRAFAIGNVTKTENTLTVPYTGARTGTNEKISYIITDKDQKEIKDYGNKAATSESGEIVIDISAMTADDKLFVFNEQVNVAKKTNYASELQEVTIPGDFMLTVNVNDSTMGMVVPSKVNNLWLGVRITLTATANEGYKFVRFESNDVTIATNGTDGTFTMPAKDVTVTAVFEEHYPVKVDCDSAKGSVAVNPAKPKQGESVTLTATANEGYRFTGFTSADIDKLWTSGNEGMFAMPDKDVTVTANFEAVSQTEHTITVSTNFSGMGTVSSDKATAAFGEEVTLTATAKPGNEFVQFASPDVEISADGTFVMPDKNVYVQALFKADASFENNTSTPIQAQKDNGTAILRFMWTLDKTDGAYIANVGAYILPWDMFESNAAAKPGVVLVNKPTMKSGDTFSADYIHIPETHFGTNFCAIPFVNGTFFTNALLYGNVNQYDVHKAE